MSLTRVEEPDGIEPGGAVLSLRQAAVVQIPGDDLVADGFNAEAPHNRVALSIASSGRGRDDRRARSRTELVGIGVTLAGLVLLLFAGYLFGWTQLQAGHNQRQLSNAFGRGANAAAYAGKIPPDGSPAAVLQIPALGIRQIVVEGTSASDLEQGPGIMPTAPFPGTGGEAVIAGRNLTYGGVFGSLGNLKPGDVIETTDYLGAFRYVVTRSLVIPPGGSLPVVRSNLGLLALVTSNGSVPPSGFFVVQARLSGNPVKGPGRQPAPAAASELALAGDSGAVLPMLAWGIAFTLVLAGTVAAYRRTGRTLLVYVISTPILLPLALFTFQNAARLLPATM